MHLRTDENARRIWLKYIIKTYKTRQTDLGFVIFGQYALKIIFFQLNSPFGAFSSVIS